MNIAFHAGNALLVLVLARSVANLTPIAAAFTAIVFALLPVEAESVAWITGRVDSMPAFFYLATFLAYAKWRAGGATSVRMYVASLGLFFLALFSKQTTITMVATLTAYDLLIAERPVRISWSWLRPYVPFGLMTAGFLLLRYAVVGTVVREQALSAQGLRFFVELFGHHLHHTIAGYVASPSLAAWSAVVLFTCALTLLAFLPDHGSGRRRIARIALCLGPVWWVLGIAPTAVAGYESPRHVYLASMGWAVLLGIGLDVLIRRSPRRAWRYAVAAGAVAIITVYTVQLHTVLRGWHHAAAMSKRAVARLQREALAATPGTLVIIGAPIKTWEWSAPFMAQPPYTRTDLTARVYVVTPWRLHCCRPQWQEYTRRILRTWAARPDRPPVVALYVNPRTGDISRLTDAEYPDLRSLATVLIETDSLETLDRAILDVLEKLVDGRS